MERAEPASGGVATGTPTASPVQAAQATSAASATPATDGMAPTGQQLDTGQQDQAGAAPAAGGDPQLPTPGPPEEMERAEPASGGVHDTKWTEAEIAEWKQTVAQVTRQYPPARNRVKVVGLYNKRGAPELMDLATFQALSALVDDVCQWGGNDSSVLVAHDGVKTFTDRMLGLQHGMVRDQTPAVLVSKMPEDPSGHWYQSLWSLVGNWEM